MLTTNKLFMIWLIGFMSGFTLMLGNTLNYWLAAEKLDLRTIGVFAFIYTPYAINFIWAPIFDTKTLGKLTSFFGKRLSWIWLIQLLLAVTIFFLSLLNPVSNTLIFACIATFVSLLASAQDTLLGALRTEIISPRLQGRISGIYIFGYRIGMLLSGFGAIYLSQYISWQQIYQLFALLVISCPILLILNIKKLQAAGLTYNPSLPETPPSFTNKASLPKLITTILKPIGPWRSIAAIIAFLILYRLPDNFINMMINPFLLHVGYNATEIATAGKFFGIVTAIIGGFIASIVMRNRNLMDSLLIFGIIHAVAHSLFIVQEIYGKNLYLFFLVTGFESITGGMTMAAYISFIASLCHGRFRATQYSFFSAMMGFSRAIFPALSGYIVVDFGWRSFFAFTTIITIPSLLLIYFISKKFKGQKFLQRLEK